MLSKAEKSDLKRFLSQDISKGDVTAKITPKQKCTAFIKVHENCVVSGIEEAKYIFSLRNINATALVKDGKNAKRGAKIMKLTGSNRGVLEAERVALNVLGRMSAVATYCSKASSLAKEKVSVTRKTMPGLLWMDKKAASHGNAWTHRKNLNDMVLLKENHLLFFESIREAVRKAKHGKKRVEAEAETKAEALEAAEEQPDILMLDDFSPKKAKETIRELRKHGFKGKIEVSGGITLKNLRSYSNIGADIISMGELTKKAGIVDYSLRISK